MKLPSGQLRVLVVAVLFAALALRGVVYSQVPRSTLSETGVSNGSPPELHVANELAQQISTSEWLGPMAPLALSPFFGITCLSGIAIWGESWIPGEHSIFKKETPLKNPLVFWVFLALTILTSVPRFTKVSKPFAQAIDHLETFSGIISLIVFRFMVAGSAESEPMAMVYQAGVVSMSANVLLTIAMAINVIVVNLVKFFFECLVWVTPVPFLDACFEVMNKATCVALMVLYAYSPTLATVVNITIFAVCLFVFRWVLRRVVFYREMVVDPILSRIFSGHAAVGNSLTIFPNRPIGPFAALAKVALTRDNEGWRFQQTSWYGNPSEYRVTKDGRNRILIRRGWFTNQLDVEQDGQVASFTFSQRHNSVIDQLAERLSAIHEGAGVSIVPLAT